ncbi:MAG TPA: hypothetical protein DHV48_10460 [Prolixibacteraceae bacterium]|nr:hypothetical protein [Prolixibacteraceae bacterium]
MKTIKILLYLLFLVLIISNVFWISQARDKVNIIKSFIQKDDFLQSTKSTQLELSLLQLKSEGTQIDLKEEFIDENGKVNRLIDLVRGQHFNLVLRYSQIGCHTCTDKMIQLLHKELPDIAVNKVIILSKLSAKRDLVVFRRVHKLNNIVFNCDNRLTPIDDIDKPYFFIIAKDRIISKVFIPIEGVNDELTKAYLGHIAQFLKDQN